MSADVLVSMHCAGDGPGRLYSPGRGTGTSMLLFLSSTMGIWKTPAGHAQEELFLSTECYPRVPRLLPLSRCWEATARRADLWPLYLSGWFLVSNVMNKKKDVSRHSVPTNVMTVGSWVKKTVTICFLVQLPLTISFSAYLPTLFQFFWPKRWAMFLAGDIQQNCECQKYQIAVTSHNL